MKIKDVMSADMEVLDSTATLEEAAQVMADADVASVPVVRDGVPVGFITDRDIVVAGVAAGLAPGTTAVEDVMTQDVVRCGENADVEEAAGIMAAAQIRQLLVVDEEGELAGVVTLSDLAGKTEDASLNVPVHEAKAPGRTTPR